MRTFVNKKPSLKAPRPLSVTAAMAKRTSKLTPGVKLSPAMSDEARADHALKEFHR
jgi:hypothetical protein